MTTFAMLTQDHGPVQSDREILGGTLVFRGTRIPAQTLFDYLDSGDTFAAVFWKISPLS